MDVVFVRVLVHDIVRSVAVDGFNPHGICRHIWIVFVTSAACSSSLVRTIFWPMNEIILSDQVEQSQKDATKDIGVLFLLLNLLHAFGDESFDQALSFLHGQLPITARVKCTEEHATSLNDFDVFGVEINVP